MEREAIDDTARADWLRPFGAWENVTATVVAQQIISWYAPGFTYRLSRRGSARDDLLDGTERINGALRLLAKLIGGYYYFEDYDLHCSRALNRAPIRRRHRGGAARGSAPRGGER